ncbi:hypothetical protein [Luteolibacter luteus]|uniref:Peptidase M10 metallopeptidase domain-containing protein n=1 Tax=Luteolibacter luteus TaxID=2728835 RepID=A0A858RGV2_9BACT|nr:hypothetical protein [Luteolibacter luteus]QJE95510.1 hypothetical protein HHL09_06840 [Luteolibacter luteus]
MARSLACALLLLPVAGSCLTIDLRYDLDASGFFNRPGAKEALRRVADFYEDLIVDQLGAINPSQYPGATWTPTYADPISGLAVPVPGKTNMIVPANTLIIFVGSAVLPPGTAAQAGPGGFTGLSAEGLNSGHPWGNQVYNRGQAGAIRLVKSGGTVIPTANPTDFAPWGGALFFNSSQANWNFSTTSATGTAGPDAVSVALHELAHILGIGAFLPQNSWTTLSVTGVCTGPLSAQSFGAQVLTDGSHLFPIGVNSRALGIFGRTHGASLAPLMVTNLPHSNNFYVPTDLDLSILQDMGWEIEPPTPVLQVQMNAGPRLRIPSTTGFNYQIYRSTNLSVWSSPLPLPLPGDGSRLTWIEPQSASAAFYRVARQKVQASVRPALPSLESNAADDGGKIAAPDLVPTSCRCGGH